MSLIDTIYVNVQYFNGQGEDEDGIPYYVASSDELMFTTDGTTFEELLANIRECLLLNLQDTNSIEEFGVDPAATVKIVMELPNDYAKTA